jgi:hypothetical protein
VLCLSHCFSSFFLCYQTELHLCYILINRRLRQVTSVRFIAGLKTASVCKSTSCPRYIKAV